MTQNIATISTKLRFLQQVKLTLGKYEDLEKLERALYRCAVRVGIITEEATEIVKKIPVAKTPTEIEIVFIDGWRLGFRESVRRDTIYRRAKEYGLNEVPAEVGPQLGLAGYLFNQSRDESILIGMDPIPDSSGKLRLFHLMEDVYGKLLEVNEGDPAIQYHPNYVWAFTPARKKSGY